MAISIFTVSEETERKCKMPPKRIRFLIIALIIILIIGVFLITYFLTSQSKPEKENNELIPPNPEYPLPPSPSRLHTFRKGAVCTDGPPCSAIGRDILTKNGSAVDATIAAMFCNGLVNMQSMGLGGGFLMTIYINDTKTAYTLNARESAPLKVTPDMYEDDPNKSKKGPLAVAVPGELRGYWTAYKRFGKLPWEDLIEPTIQLCENGFNMSKPLWDALFFNQDMKNDPLFYEWFVDPNTNNFHKGNSLITPKKLCETLRIIAKNGGDDLYNGTLSKMLIQDIEDMKGIITQNDLDIYEAKWEEPISVQFQNKDILYSVQPPGGGVLLAFILNILDGYNFNKESINGLNNTVLTYHRIIEAFKYAYAKRTELGDPEFVNIVELIHNLTSSDYASQIKQSIKIFSTNQDPEHYGAIYYNQSDHGTAHISVIAPNGDAVSVTSTINLYFGAGITSKRTGIVLNSCMDDFSLSTFTSFFGIPGSPANSIAPKKRALSSMSPSIIVDQNRNVKIVIGASGGTRITTAVALVIMRYLWFDQDIKEAIDAPRFHHQIFPMEISYEYGILQQIIQGLEKIGHKTNRYRDRGSIICTLVKKDDKIIGNADFRKGGDVFGFD